MIHTHAEPLHSAIIPWPFMKWGIDIVGKLPIGSNQKVFVLVLTDYFTKWIKAKAFSRVRDKEVMGFIWKHIICRFGIPREIVTDNGFQFILDNFQQFCQKWGIKVNYSTPRYPASNAQAEASNKTLMTNLKKRLDLHKSKWVE